MKKALFALLVVSSLAHADWRDPFEPVDMTKNFTNRTTVTIRPVNDPTAECSAERSRRGYAKYGGAVEACTIWEKDSCLIIIGKTTNRDTIGHEMQHCLQGKFH